MITVDIESQASNISPIGDLGLFISRLAGAILLVAGAATFGYLVWGGIQWILAGSDKNKVEEAQARITNAFIGLAVTAASWAVFLLINHFLGLNIAGAASSGGNFGGGTGTSGGSSTITGNPSCVCGGAGGCATTGTIGALTIGGACFRCDSAGWTATGNTGTCIPITCAQCP